jgi:hypothetical protein
MGALTDDIATFISMNVLVSILLHEISCSHPTITISYGCPCHLVDVSCPYSTIGVLLCPDGFSHVASYGSLEGKDYLGGKC